MDKRTQAWDDGTLGRDERFVAKSNTTQEELADILGLQAISIRMPKELLQDLKDLAQLHGLGYQPLIKQILTRFVEGEKKMLANEKIREELAQKKQNVA